MPAPSKPLTSILVKPAGPDCNMACTYCFYLPKAKIFPETDVHRMSIPVLTETVRQTMAQAGSQVSFGWQGGEPTLMGLGFFREAVALQEKHGRGREVGNGLQTNGLLIDEEWAKFLSRYRVLVGLSLDGPEHVHDHYRRTRGGSGTWSKVVDRAKLMLDAGVAVNALATVSDHTVRFPEETYGFLKELGLTFMQFIPIIEPDPDHPGQAAPFSVPPEEFGHFLCKLFDLWIGDFENGAPTTSVRFFDSVFHTYVGLPAPECTLQAECGSYVVVEHNGDVYSCDFFVDPEHRLGNVMEDRLIDCLNAPRQKAFGKAKADLPDECAGCSWLAYCRGGCTKDRAIRQNRDSALRRRSGGSRGGTPALSALDLQGTEIGRNSHLAKLVPVYLCAAFKAFFAHAHDRLQELAREWRQRQAMELDAARSMAGAGSRGSDRAGSTGRNDPCPCGSGRKYKRCCGTN